MGPQHDQYFLLPGEPKIMHCIDASILRNEGKVNDLLPKVAISNMAGSERELL
jgi:hypothetical protein